VYEVQVGAFEHEEHAQAVLEQVQDWFPKTYIAPRQGPEGKYPYNVTFVGWPNLPV
jgi:hypothetical protein